MRKYLTPIILFTLTLAAWIGFYPKLPNRIPIHWGWHGQIDGYAPKVQAMLIFLGMMIAIYMLFLFLPKIDPKRKNYKYFSRSFDRIQTVILFIFFVINLQVILSGLGYQIPMTGGIFLIIGLLFLVLGNYIQSVKPNFFIGIRTPWTLSNDEVWKKTHRAGARVSIVSGLILIVAGFLPDIWRAIILITVIVALIIFSFGYSYWIYRKINGYHRE